MRKFFCFLLIISSFNVFAQVEKPITKGNTMIGGAMQLSSFDIHFNTFQFNASPSYAYFVANQLAVGMELPFHVFKLSQIHNYSFGYSPFVRYYFNNGLFASFQFKHIFYDYQDINSIQTKQSRLMFSPGIGYSYFLNKNVALEGGLFYEHSFDPKNGYAKGNDFQLRFGFQIFIPENKD